MSQLERVWSLTTFATTGMVVGVILMFVTGIVDEADKDLLSGVVEYGNENRRENWIDLHSLKIIKYATALHLELPLHPAILFFD